jgi:integrase
VADLVDAPRFEPHEMHPLSREEARRLLDAARGERLEALLVLALATGMRRSELLALHWRDLDLQGVQPSLGVRSRVVRVKGAFEFAEPKTRKSRRRIALSSPTVEALRRHHAAQLQERLALGQAWGSGQDFDLVFASPVGMPTGPWVFERVVNKCLARSGLPHIRVHDLRHTCATLLLGARVNPKVVSEMLGHASVAITLDIYSHVLPDMQQDAAAVMAQVLYGS